MYAFLNSWVFPLIPALLWLYYFIRTKHSYWSRKGVPGPAPLPFIGNLHSRTLRDVHELEIEWMHKHGKLYGTYVGFEPHLIVIDAELIKQVLIKDFPSFMNRFKLEMYHEMWNQNLLTTNDDAWKRIRTITTPAFTTGKLRGMHPLMGRSVDKLVAYFNKVVDSTSAQHGVIDTKEVIAGFTIDVIASTCFATDTDANGERVKPNPVVKYGRMMFDVPPFRVAAAFLFPGPILKLLGIDSFFHPEAFNFLINFTRHIVRGRRSATVGGSVTRTDLVQLLVDANVAEHDLKSVSFDKLEASAESKDDQIQPQQNEPIKTKSQSAKMLSESEIIAQCIFFFSAGFETTASTISHCIFELARNSAIQERLNHELHTALDKFNPTEESCHQSAEYFETILTGIPYLEAVIKETLRKYPSVTQLTRIVGIDGYKLNGIELFKHQVIEIPVSAVHHCPEYYPEPDRFNPERFMPENKHLLVPYTYLPFGAGPRNCVGVRFAYQEIKLCLASIVRLFHFDVTPNTPSKLSFKNGNVLMNAYEFPIKVSRRV